VIIAYLFTDLVILINILYIEKIKNFLLTINFICFKKNSIIKIIIIKI